HNFFTEYFAVQPDGKILLAGSYQIGHVLTSGVRLNADGSLDNSFQLQNANRPANHVGQQPDGKIIFGGTFYRYGSGESHPGLVRLNSNGTVDNTFTGSVSYPDGGVNAIEQQPDGKVLVGGLFQRANGQPRGNLVRFNTDGTLDKTFNIGIGTAGTFDNYISDIAL
ncbi:MAG: delta-60 repeat domain-containing protein, partial [Acidobacteria bacterium]|nr:delta-60 repeat domain-containing protein [Acidobacteriota bacterium]